MTDLSETNRLLKEITRQLDTLIQITKNMDATVVQTLITDLLEALAALTAAQSQTAAAQAAQTAAQNALAALQATDAALQDPALGTAAAQAIANAAAANLPPLSTAAPATPAT
jgi:hypothetical protein